MRLFVALVILAILITFIVVSPSLAHHNEAMALAARYWGRQACHGSVHVHMKPLPGKMGGEAVIGGCTIWMDQRRWDFPLYCAVFLHEYGHLLGYHESRNRDSVMYPTVQFIPEICYS